MSEIGSSGVPEESYPVTCWNCLGEFDALRAVWCSDDAKNPSKVCPFCFRCFCEASPRYKQDFWTHAPSHLVEELETLARSKDRLGDILIRMKKLTTPQLLEVLIAQKESGRKLGEILVERGLVAPEAIRAALARHGVSQSLKLVHRGSFIKDFATLGLEMDDRVRLIEELQSAFGLVLVTSPAFSGSITTAYSIMSYLVQSHRDVLSLESPIHWLLDGSRQVEVEAGPGGPRMEETLHSVVAGRPDVFMFSAGPRHAAPGAATRLASSPRVGAPEHA